MSEKQEIFWLTPVPKHCQVCRSPIDKVFYDAHLKFPYNISAEVCSICFKKYCNALGIGIAQEYTKHSNGNFKQTAGGSGKY